MAEEVAKKRKTYDNKIFIEFLKDKDKYLDLKDVVQLISNGVGPLPCTACPLKIEAADASLCKTFSRAYCRAQNHPVKRENRSSPYDYMAISIGSLFKPGCATLLNFFEDQTVPDDEQRFDALKRLVTLLTKPDMNELLKNTKEDEPGFLERNWCIKMAQHLLSELSPSKNYVIDNSYRHCVSKDDLPVYPQGQASKGKEFCPCRDQEELVGKYGDTSFGCQTLWHGKADLFFGIPLQFMSGAGDASTSGPADDDQESSSSIGIEAKSANEFSMQDKYQMRAQAIVFGFLIQKKHKKENTAGVQNFLVPHLGFSKEKFCFHFFDCVNDILLETNAFNLFQSGKLSNYFVVLAWLALNYKLFGGETPDSLLEYKSGFLNLFGEEVLKKYSQEVEHPCHVESSLTAENLFLDLVTVKREDWQTEKTKFTGRNVYD